MPSSDPTPPPERGGALRFPSAAGTDGFEPRTGRPRAAPV